MRCDGPPRAGCRVTSSTVTDPHSGPDDGAWAVSFRRLDPSVPVPTRAHAGDAGVDLTATEDVVIDPGARVLVGTGIAVALPVGTVGLIHPRSGLAARTGLSVVNTPGTIDAGYRGEIKVCLINHDRSTPIELRRGDRVAQLVVQRVELPRFVEVDTLDETTRGHGGYGSSGGHAALGDAPTVQRTSTPGDGPAASASEKE